MDSPSANEFEINIFGRGYGESLLLHLGNNEWFVIDSCLDDQNQPCVLNYLNKINVDPAAIKYVAATHWHTDHIRGLSQVCKEAEHAYFIFSQALKTHDFLTLLFGHSEIPGAIKSSTQEFCEILEIYRERIRSNQSVERFVLASENKMIHKDSAKIGTDHILRSILALSPSEAAVMRSLQDISALLPGKLKPLRNLRGLKPNHTSIVLLINLGKLCLLLSSDLEELGVMDDGWSAIINNRIQLERKAEVFKIPHHGSKNGHHEEVWKNFVSSQNVSLLTPFHHGKTQIPTEEDLKRIRLYSQYAYIAGASKQISYKTDRETKNMLRKLDKKPYRVERKMGRVTLRKNILRNEDWSIYLEGETCNVNNLVN